MTGAPLYEVDRKMLYAFSMDSFSDRQQLFLYILQAETTAPAIGAETRSLAGGKAVAIVWRDPYPRNARINNNNSMSFDDLSVVYDYARNGTIFPDPFHSRSPWWQLRGDTGFTKKPRQFGHHEQRVLFFKQLNN